MNLNKFIARRDNKIFYCSNEIGVKPILSKLNENIDFYKDADIEDTVVGKQLLVSMYSQKLNMFMHIL